MLVGWDWASTAHDGTVIDDAGAVVDRWTPPHTEAGLSDALVRLGRSGRPEGVPAAAEERPRGDRACQRPVRGPALAPGHPVVPVHASAFHVARALSRLAGRHP